MLLRTQACLFRANSHQRSLLQCQGVEPSLAFPMTMPAHSLSSTPGVLQQSAVSLPTTAAVSLPTIPGLLQQASISPATSTTAVLQRAALSLPTSGLLQQGSISPATSTTAVLQRAALSLPTSCLLQQGSISPATSTTAVLQRASLSTTAATVQQPFQTVQQIEQGIQQALQVDTTGLVSQQGPLSDVSIPEHENSHMSHLSQHSVMSDRSVIPNTPPAAAASVTQAAGDTLVGGSQAPTGPSGDDWY